MKQLIFSVMLLFGFLCFGQTQNITFDYNARYLMPDKNKTTTDTLTISFAKGGGHIYTDSHILANYFGLNIFGSDSNISNTTIGLLYDSREAMIALNYEMANNLMYIKMDLATIAALRNNASTSTKLLSLESEQTEDVMFMGEPRKTFAIFPKDKPENIITILFDESKPVNNNVLLTGLLNRLLGMTGEAFESNLNLPDGIILAIFDAKGTTIIEAIETMTVPLNLEINHTFKAN